MRRKEFPKALISYTSNQLHVEIKFARRCRFMPIILAT
jgi:hypothetical protein